MYYGLMCLRYLSVSNDSYVVWAPLHISIFGVSEHEKEPDLMSVSDKFWKINNA
jgi:hypothetical protein